MTLDTFFQAKSIAVIGASREPGKIGHTIVKNLVSGGYTGKIYPVNPNATDILGRKCYPSLSAVQEPVELAVICVPAAIIFPVVKNVIKKKVNAVIVITSGFKEIGNHRDEMKLARMFKKAKIPCIGPNCLGVFDAHTKLDTLFLPIERLKRPQAGTISFISQSGALGSAMLDLAAAAGLGFAKFVSYGNAADVNENHLLDYLDADEQTRVICLYIEGLADGKEFMRVARKVRKPVVVIKGGHSAQGSKAALSHTGSIAGESGIYSGAFKQTGLIEVDDLEDMFGIAHVFEKLAVTPRGKRVQIITNGGGHGIVTTDAVAANHLLFAELSANSNQVLKKNLPAICSIANPLDIVGDATAERFILAVSTCLKDPKVDALVVNILPQTPTVDHDKAAQALQKMNITKPVVLVTTGGEFAARVTRKYEAIGLPVYQYPSQAVKALAAYVSRSIA
ncbi:CoA-binding protein [Candidatus Woesearchaeota archaeon]|nr:CoA-binding protein [Candidatus Woesearchaeota archaeon]